ncbi:hypothetical protein CNR22_06730 [Sphingobacteriaceae bacterium]|nr:hypothetical protein CNR22_06730 [Sphingobacteriaceae bacterium]
MQTLKKFAFRNAGVLAILWALFIFVLCATPGQYIPSANWLEILSFDKFVHASLFFALTVLMFTLAIKYNRNKNAFIFYFLLAVCYGASLELMQAYWFSNRSADWKDMVANTFGCVVAVLLLKKLRVFYAKEGVRQ